MELERILRKAMEKDRNMQYQHIGDLLTDLRRIKREIESIVEIDCICKIMPCILQSFFIYD